MEAREALVDVLRTVFASHGAVPMGAPDPTPVAAASCCVCRLAIMHCRGDWVMGAVQAAASWASGRRARPAMRPRCWRRRARAWRHDTTSAAHLQPGWPTGLRAGTFRRWTACGGMR